jgi:hypothetical protein
LSRQSLLTLTTRLLYVTSQVIQKWDLGKANGKKLDNMIRLLTNFKAKLAENNEGDEESKAGETNYAGEVTFELRCTHAVDALAVFNSLITADVEDN